MNVPSKLAAYALGLVVIFGGAFGVGSAVGTSGTTEGPGDNQTVVTTQTPQHGGH